MCKAITERDHTGHYFGVRCAKCGSHRTERGRDGYTCHSPGCGEQFTLGEALQLVVSVARYPYLNKTWGAAFTGGRPSGLPNACASGVAKPRPDLSLVEV